MDRLNPPARTGARGATKTALLVSTLLALAIGGLVVYFIWPRDEPGADRGAEKSPQAAGEAPAPAGEATPPGLVVTPGGEGEGSPETPDVPEAKTGEPAFRIVGKVTDPDGAPLADITVRWLPVETKQVEPYRRDGALWSTEAQVAALPAGKLKDVLGKGTSTSSGTDGAYVLAILEAKVKQGAVVAAGSGFEAGVKDVEPPALEPDAEAGPEDIELNFTLKAACTLSGTVTDKLTGKPAPGMKVVAGLVEADKPAFASFVKPGTPGAIVRSDGTYFLNGLAPGEYHVVPRTGGSEYLSLMSKQGRKVLLEKGMDLTEVDFEVLRGGRIRGTVIGAEKKPLEGAKVGVIPIDFMASAMKGDVEAMASLNAQDSRTDATGRFEVSGVPLGKELRVHGGYDGYAPGATETLELTEEQPEAEVTLTLERGWSISGRVVFKDGASAPEKPVHIVPDLGALMAGKIVAGMDKRAVTDADGAFTLTDLPPGTYKLRAGQMTPQDMFAPDMKSQEVELDGVSDTTGVELVIGADNIEEVAGTVVDNAGNPVGGATVRIAEAVNFTPNAGMSVESGADGSFIATPRGGGPFRVEASKNGYAPGVEAPVTLGTMDLQLVVTAHGQVSGRVFLPDGTPGGQGGKVEAKPVVGESMEESIRRLQRMGMNQGKRDSGATVGEDGTFTVEAPAGKIRIHATLAGYAPAVSKDITLGAGEAYAGVTIQLSVGAVVHGLVVLPDGGYAEGATVRAEPVDGEKTSNMLKKMMPQFFATERNRATTGKDGGFEIPQLLLGEYELVASLEGYAPSEAVEVRLAQDQVKRVANLQLQKGGVIVGEAIEGEKGKPGVMVQLMAEGTMKQVVTDPKGQFRFEGLPPGGYIVNLIDMAGMQSGKISVKPRSVTIEQGETVEVSVIYGLGKKVYGMVTGHPPAPMRMVLLRRPGGPLPEEVSPLDMKASVAAGKFQAGVGMLAADGSYEIADIEPGKYIIEILKMPANPMDMASYDKMDRTPHYRATITMKEEDLKVDITIK